MAIYSQWVFTDKDGNIVGFAMDEAAALQTQASTYPTSAGYTMYTPGQDVPSKTPTGTTTPTGTLDPYVQSLYDDLFKRGGTWEQAAKDFLAALTTGGIKTGDNNGAYQIYLTIHAKYSGGGVGEVGGTVTPPGIEDIYDPYTAYLAATGLAGKAYRNPFQEYMRRQFAPMSTLYGLQGRLALGATPGVGAPGAFQEYMKPFIGTQQGLGQSAQSLWQSILGQTPEQRAITGTVYEPTYAEGELTSRGGLGELQSLLAEALRGRFGRPALEWLTGRLPEEQQLFTSRQAAGAGETFLDYLRNKFAIG